MRYFPHVNRRTNSAGCDPLPEVAVAEFPAESVTVSFTFSGCDTPSSVDVGLPHVSVNDNVGSVPVIVFAAS